MPARRVVYTCLFGYSEKFNDYPHEPETDIDFVCFTDDPALTAHSWKVEPMTRGLLDAPRASKQIKLLPHRFLSQYDESLYLDNTIRLKRPARALFDDLLASASLPWIVFRHPQRNCVYAEMDEVARVEYDDAERIDKQRKTYRRLGYPSDLGLATCPVLLRRHNDPSVVAFGEAWFEQVLRHSLRDQLSFNVVAWNRGFEFAYADAPFDDNEYFEKPPLAGHRLPRDFDDERYLDLNPDVSGHDPRQHYYVHGIYEGRPYK